VKERGERGERQPPRGIVLNIVFDELHIDISLGGGNRLNVRGEILIDQIDKEFEELLLALQNGEGCLALVGVDDVEEHLSEIVTIAHAQLGGAKRAFLEKIRTDHTQLLFGELRKVLKGNGDTFALLIVADVEMNVRLRQKRPVFYVEFVAMPRTDQNDIVLFEVVGNAVVDEGELSVVHEQKLVV